MSDNSIKIVMKKSDSILVKNRLVIHYNNIDSPFITLYLYKNDKLDFIEKIELENYEVVNGLPVNLNKIAELIKNYVYKIDSINLAISCNDTFKTTTSLPKISKFKVKKLYKNLVKDEQGDYKNNYIPFYEYYSYSLGYIFYTYYIPQNIVNEFVKLAVILKTKLTKVDLFSHFVFNNVKNKIEENFILHYEDNGLSTLILSYDKAFSSTITFSSKEDNMNLYFTSIISKHSFELEKKDVNVIYTNMSNFTFDLCEVKEINVSFDTYNFKGIDL